MDNQNVNPSTSVTVTPAPTSAPAAPNPTAVPSPTAVPTPSVNPTAVPTPTVTEAPAPSAQPAPSVQPVQNEQPSVMRESAPSPAQTTTYARTTVGNPVLNSDDMLRAFIGPNYEKIISRPFNFAAFFFTALYFFYRKMTLYGIIIMIVQGLLSYFFSNNIYILIVVNVICALLANRMYVNFAVRKINKLLLNNSEKNLLEVKGMCYVVGGRSFVRIFTTIIWSLLALIPVGMIVVLFGLSTSLTDLIKNLNIEIPSIQMPDIEIPDITLESKFDGYLVVDKTYKILEYFRVETPSNFTPTSNNDDYQLEYSFKSNDKKLGSCTYNFKAIKEYSSAKTLIQQMHDYYLDKNPSEVTSAKVNRIDWYSFHYETDEATIYYNACFRGRLVYLYTFIDQKDSEQACHDYTSYILNTIKFRGA